MSIHVAQSASHPEGPLLLATKADSLAAARARVRCAAVEEMFVLSVGEWKAAPGDLLRRVRARLGGGKLAVRSSAVGEDGADASMAGLYSTRLNVQGSDPLEVRRAIEAVITSYPSGEEHQVLIQRMLSGVVMSGVAMSRVLADGGPYIVINYDDESGRTDTITGGSGVNKTVFVYRSVDSTALVSPRVAAVVALVHELEALTGGAALDIEFAIDQAGTLHLLQLRRIAAARRWLPGIAEEVSSRIPRLIEFLRSRARPRPGIAGHRTLFGVMPDWNPAEIIGVSPSRLAASLYRELITRSTWREAREAMGYRPLPGEELMVMVGGRPYIDVRSSFNSLLPASIDEQTAARIVDAWIDRLDLHPELHDKVEFEVAQTCLDAGFDEVWDERYGDIVAQAAKDHFRDALRSITAAALDLSQAGTLPRAEGAVQRLEALQASHPASLHDGAPPLAAAATLLDQARALGTLPFAILARHAFIAEAILRSLVRQGAIKEERLQTWRRSLHTVSGEFLHAHARLSRGEIGESEFLAEYGHLRPGTYDIRSPSYADRREIAGGRGSTGAEAPLPEFTWTPEERAAIGRWLVVARLGTSPERLLEHARRAVIGREHAKFVFTRNLSRALDRIAQWGEDNGLDREALSHIPWPTLADLVTSSTRGRDLVTIVEQGRAEAGLSRTLRLPHLIRGETDLYVIPQHRSQPNFLGSATLHAPVVHVHALTGGSVSLDGRIVCIENADPGYDWIFSHRIAGLITQYGGTNSHMAIRCAEFGIPAAIGCGTQLFERVVAAGAAELDCAGRALRPVHV